MKNNIRIQTYILSAVLIFLLYLALYFTLGSDSYYSTIIINVLIYILFAVSLNMTVGIMGQLSLGHAGFIAIGAYGGAYFTKLMMASQLPSLLQLIISSLIGGIIAGLFGLLIAVPTLRLKGDYLAIITLAFGEIIKFTLQNLDFLGGASGMKSIPILDTFTNVYWIVVVCVILITMLLTSRQGRTMLSIREDEIAAENIGISTNRVKLYGFAMSAFFAGIGGSLLAHNISILQPAKFSFVFSIDILVMVVLGGLGSITGASIAAAILTILNEVLRQYSEWRYFIYALALILIMIFRPTGILGTKEFTISGILRKIKNRTKKSELGG